MKEQAKYLRCVRCKSDMEMYKEDQYRWWYKCTDKECDMIMTSPKPLKNKKVDEVPNGKKNNL